MKTTAQKISAMFYNDGQRFKTKYGKSLFAACRERGTWPDTDGDAERWAFPDGSVITIAGEGWDLGYPDCFCWRGAGHADDCRAENMADDNCELVGEEVDA